MDKLNEMLIGALAIVGGVVTKRVFRNQDALNDRLSHLEERIATKDDIHAINDNIALILSHLLDKK